MKTFRWLIVYAAIFSKEDGHFYNIVLPTMLKNHAESRGKSGYTVEVDILYYSYRNKAITRIREPELYRFSSASHNVKIKHIKDHVII